MAATARSNAPGFAPGSSRLNRFLRRAALLLLASTPLLLGLARLDAAVDDPLAVLHPDVMLGTDDYRRLERAEPVVKILPADRSQIRTFAAAVTQADDQRFLSWMSEICALKRGPHVLACHRFSDTPALSDLDGLSLGPDDLDDVRECDPGDCRFKITDPELTSVKQALSGPDGERSANAAFRQVLLDRVQRHLARARGAQGAGTRVTIEDGFGHLPQVLGFRWRPVSNDPDSVRRAIAVPGGSSFVYWSKERAAGKPIISLTEVTLVEPENAGSVLAAAVSTQLFATRYMDGSNSLSVLTRSRDGSRRYLAYLNQSNVDLLGGMFGGVTRMLMSRRIRSESGALVLAVKSRMESGMPGADQSGWTASR